MGAARRCEGGDCQDGTGIVIGSVTWDFQIGDIVKTRIMVDAFDLPAGTIGIIEDYGITGGWFVALEVGNNSTERCIMWSDELTLVLP